MDKELEDLIELIKIDIADLARWSVYHADKFNEEMGEIDKLIKKIEGDKL